MREAGLQPLEEYSGSLKPWRCKCKKCGNIVTPTYSNVNRGQGGCKYCKSAKIRLKLLMPESDALRIMRANGLEPRTPYSGTKSPWLSKHIPCGRLVTPRLEDIKQGQGGCIHCAKKVRANSKRLDNDLAAKVMMDAGLKPIVPYPGRNDLPWKSECLTCGTFCSPWYSNVQQRGGGCPQCANGGRRVKHLLPASAARQMMTAAGFTPLVAYPGSNTPWRCRCKECRRVSSPRLATVKQGSGCRFCADVERGMQRRLDPRDAAALMRDRGLTPVEPYVGADNVWRCKCRTCKKIVRARYSNILQGHSGCPNCSRQSFVGKPAIVYLITHDGLEAVKVGIARQSSPRLAAFIRKGWCLVEKWTFSDGADVLVIEEAILFWLPTCIVADCKIGHY